MISTATYLGKVRFIIYDRSFYAQVSNKFLTSLIRTSLMKVPLIMDNLRVYHSKIVKAWVGLRIDQIKLRYLPS